jgi:hypothetical protein
MWVCGCAGVKVPSTGGISTNGRSFLIGPMTGSLYVGHLSGGCGFLFRDPQNITSIGKKSKCRYDCDQEALSRLSRLCKGEMLRHLGPGRSFASKQWKSMALLRLCGVMERLDLLGSLTRGRRTKAGTSQRPNIQTFRTITLKITRYARASPVSTACVARKPSSRLEL